MPTFVPKNWYDLPPARPARVDAGLWEPEGPPAQPLEEDPDGLPGAPGQDDAVLPDDPGFWREEQLGPDHYNRYEVAVRRVRRSGLYGMPEASGPRGRAHVVRTHAPVCLLVVGWLAERVGAKPVLPHPELDDPNLVLQYDEVTPEAAAPMPDGVTFIYRVRGVYTYLMQYAPEDGDALLVPTLAVVTTPAAEHTIGPAQWDRTLLSGVVSAAYANPQPVTF